MSTNAKPLSPNLIADPTALANWLDLAPAGDPWNRDNGFLTLEDDTDFLYKCTTLYHPPSDRGIRWDDPDIGIAWPDVGLAPLLSANDTVATQLAAAEDFA